MRENPPCVGKMESLVGELQCLPPTLRVPLIANIVFSSSAGPHPTIGMTAWGNMNRPIIDLYTGRRCTLNVGSPRIESKDGHTGEIYLPALCAGKRYDFAWHLQGLYSRYMGLLNS